MTKVLAGLNLPADGTITRSGSIGYLPQDPKVDDMSQLAKDRILSARALDGVARKMRQAQDDMASEDPTVRAKGMRRYDRLEAEFIAGGGYAAESEAAVITSNLDLPERVLSQPLSTLSGGQRRRVELARILFSNADTMLLDEPTNHLDADSILWLRDFLKNFSGALLVISHDVELMELVVNRVFYLDANRCVIDQYNMGWKNYLMQREQDEHRRKRERANAQKKANALLEQAVGFRKSVRSIRLRRFVSLTPLPAVKPRFLPGGCRNPMVRLRFLQTLIWLLTGVHGWWCWDSTVRVRLPCCVCWRVRLSRIQVRWCMVTGRSWGISRRSMKFLRVSALFLRI